ncbi:STAS domain-containing protein [Actinoallomurus rhizosphaericola]|uniref:STAS domain-containing protein n=1 Tax=Actinoallomurus rhizosphaericola TaxID=2952536 RepID=UPI0020921E40|nr:STAS domain-containing protein [Actinoallomurus rhizosphaericola]MCO5997943.1 STAS domain-containing protein [Actinoallomurus rhizosphaericola]
MTDRVLTATTHAHPAGPAVISVAGELDYYTAAHLRQAVQETAFTAEGVIIDLTDLTYCDSTGITVLVTAYHRAQASKAPLALVGLNPDLNRVFGIVGLHDVFASYPTVDEAVAAL